MGTPTRNMITMSTALDPEPLIVSIPLAAGREVTGGDIQRTLQQHGLEIEDAVVYRDADGVRWHAFGSDSLRVRGELRANITAEWDTAGVVADVVVDL